MRKVSNRTVLGEEIMFIMDVPYVPMQETPIVLVQAGTAAGSTPQPDYILKECQETESTGDPRSAMRAVDPAYMLKNYLQGRDGHLVELIEIKNVTLLQSVQHGELLQGRSNDTGRTTFRYNPPQLHRQRPGHLHGRVRRQALQDCGEYCCITSCWRDTAVAR